MRHHLAGVARQVQKQIEFLGREMNGLALHGDGMGSLIDDEVASLDGRSGTLRGAAQMRAHAGQQFLNAEWLGHIVVGAGVERFNL